MTTPRRPPSSSLSLRSPRPPPGCTSLAQSAAALAVRETLVSFCEANEYDELATIVRPGAAASTVRLLPAAARAAATDNRRGSGAAGMEIVLAEQKPTAAEEEVGFDEGKRGEGAG